MSELLDCGHRVVQDTGCGTGYGYDENRKSLCYACCAERDIEFMKEHDKIILYLSSYTLHDGYHGTGKVSNWPGSLEFPCTIKKGKHNIAGKRYDAWFHDKEGRMWHGVTYGDWSQLLHCKKLKAIPKFNQATVQPSH